MKILLHEQLDTGDNAVQVALNAFGARHAHPRFEALPVAITDGITFDSDHVNR